MKLKNKLLLWAAVSGLALSGCKKDFLDINHNPNQATTATPDLVLPSALATTGAIMNPASAPNTYFNGWMGYWAISGSYAISSSDFTTYKQTTLFADGYWQSLYHNLNDYHYVMVQSIAQKKPFYEAVARVMTAYDFQKLVDQFGNVPYFTAFQGTNNIHPKYDDQKAIYADLIKQLDTASTLFHRSDATGSASSDIVFGGDNGAWLRFTNTMKLRILMRQTQVSGISSYIQAEIAKITAEGSGFIGAGEDVMENPGYSAAQPSPFWASNYNLSGTYINDFWRANQFSINFFKNNNDPRLPQVYALSGTGKMQGNFLGQIGGLVGSDASVFGPGTVQSATQGAYFMPASESFFLQAEAVLRGFLSGDAQQLYRQGVIESFRQFKVPDYQNAATAYLNQSGNTNVDWATAADFNSQLALIIRQKWASENTIMPIEAYADYRRLGLPADVPLSQSPYVDVKQIPLRFLYPFSEYQTNAENVNAQGTINQHTTKIFWEP